MRRDKSLGAVSLVRGWDPPGRQDPCEGNPGETAGPAAPPISLPRQTPLHGIHVPHDTSMDITSSTMKPPSTPIWPWLRPSSLTLIAMVGGGPALKLPQNMSWRNSKIHGWTINRHGRCLHKATAMLEAPARTEKHPTACRDTGAAAAGTSWNTSKQDNKITCNIKQFWSSGLFHARTRTSTVGGEQHPATLLTCVFRAQGWNSCHVSFTKCQQNTHTAQFKLLNAVCWPVKSTFDLVTGSFLNSLQVSDTLMLPRSPWLSLQMLF